MFTSYAQNFEDVMLWRALRHIKNGCYIDIGAHDPDLDSVSRLFYEHGWRGIHVEPIAHCVQRLGASRPDEVVIQAVAGPEIGTAKFYELSIGGLSTCDREVASHHEATGLGSREYTVPCVTLKDIFARCASDTVHWLKIDVEGFEKEVLDGWGDSPVRPWIVVIESTFPNSPVSTHQKWERIILGRGYRFAYFDGLNRFYVSQTRSELLSAFATPPNVFDDFALSGTGTASFCAIVNGKIHALEGHIQEEDVRHSQVLAERERRHGKELLVQRQHAQQLDQVLAERERQHGEELLVQRQHAQHLENDWLASLNRVSDLSNQLAELSARLEASEAESLRVARQLAKRDDRISTMLNSLSWRLTAPARHVATWIMRTLVYRQIPIYTSERSSPPSPAVSRTRAYCRVSDFSDLYDEEFIKAAYQALLRRLPDPNGHEFYLGKLRGGMEKTAILGSIRYSSEGRKEDVIVDGLTIPWTMLNTLRLPLVGTLLRPVVALFRLPRMQREQRIVENYLMSGRVAPKSQKDSSSSHLLDQSSPALGRFDRIENNQLDSGSLNFVTQHSIARLDLGGPKAEPAIALIAPMPPAKTGIAWYTLSSFLAADYGVDIYAAYDSIDEYLNAIHEGRLNASNVRIFSIHALAFGRTKNKYKAQIFAVGNSDHNIRVGCALRYLAEFPVDLPTFVYIHDPCLLNLVAHVCREFHASFVSLLRSQYAAKLATASNLNFENHLALVTRCVYGPKALLSDLRVDGIFVNSTAAADVVHEDFPAFDRNRIHTLFLPVCAVPAVPSAPENRGRTRIGTFGIPSAGSKSTSIVVDAFRKLQSKRPNLELLIAGYNAHEFGRAMGFANDESILIEDSPTAPRLEALMRSCDIAVQLRNNHLGESSGIVPQLLALSKPTIVSAVGSFLEYGDAVAYAPTDVTPDQLAILIACELENTTVRVAAGETYAIAHSPARFCQRVMTLIDGVPNLDCENHLIRSVAAGLSDSSLLVGSRNRPMPRLGTMMPNKEREGSIPSVPDIA